MDRDGKAAIYDRLIGMHPGIGRKGQTIPYTSVNGHMFTMLSREGEIGIRLPAGERESFLRKYHADLLVSYGAVMKEFVQVPEALLNDLGVLSEYVDISYEYVRSLKPKSGNGK